MENAGVLSLVFIWLQLKLLPQGVSIMLLNCLHRAVQRQIHILLYKLVYYAAILVASVV